MINIKHEINNPYDYAFAWWRKAQNPYSDSFLDHWNLESFSASMRIDTSIDDVFIGSSYVTRFEIKIYEVLQK